VDALASYDAEDYEAALEKFEAISYTSKILFNKALIYATLGHHEEAVCFTPERIACPNVHPGQMF
jgi:hypothetical protein